MWLKLAVADMKPVGIIKESAKNSEKDNQSFGLVGHFALTAVLSIALAAFALGYLYQQSARSNLIENAEAYHVESARLYNKLIWSRFGEFLLKVDESSINDIESSYQFKRLHNMITEGISESNLLKIKIFNKAGMTVYSSDTTQLGSEKRGYIGFESAIEGTNFTELSFRETFKAGKDWADLHNRHVASSYLPIYNTFDSSKTIAVFEIYSDVTPLMASVLNSRNAMVSVTVFIMSVLLIVLLLNIKNADDIIKRQAKSQQELRDRADWLANHDTLTDLPNRRYFNDLLSQTLSSNAAPIASLAVLFIDIDEFKPINDNYGHSVGDKILIELARKIVNALPPGSVVARLGGDEFVATVNLANGKSETIQHYMETMFASINSPIEVNDNSFTLSTSIGVTFCLDTDKHIDQIITRADSAMYKAKKSGKNQFRFCSQSEPIVGLKIAS